jgi:MFS family permease
MAFSREQALVACLFTLFVCRVVLASAIVPPWQGPDEPVHFAAAKLLTVPVSSLEPERRDLERQVLQSMARYRWWEPYEVPTPDPVPTFFRQVARFGTGSYSQPLYYELGALVLRGTKPQSVEAAYWQLRTLSVVLSLVALTLGWAGTRLLFGPTVAVGATAIAALHPQFLLFAISVNPDALAAVLGAFMWWQVARVVSGRRPGMSLALLVVAAAAALFVKDSAIALGVVALSIVAVLMCAPRTAGIGRRTVLVGLAAVAVCGIVLVIASVLFEEPVRALVRSWRTSLNMTRPFGIAMIPQAVAYARESIDYVWLAAGWLRLHPSEPWLWVARSLTIAGLASAAVLLVRSPVVRRPLFIASLFVLVQAAVVIGLGFLTPLSPQGRYLFPVIAPATALLWLGLTNAPPVQLRPYAAPALVSVLAVMDVTGFTTVLMPAYLPW